MIFAALLLIGSVCFAQTGNLKVIQKCDKQLLNNQRATGYYGNFNQTADGMYYPMEQGEAIIMRADQFPGANVVGDTIKKIKFDAEDFSSQQSGTYNGTSFTMKIYTGAPDNTAFLTALQAGQGSIEDLSILGTCEYTENITATTLGSGNQWGINEIEITPWVITSANYWIVFIANGNNCLYANKNVISDTITYAQYQQSERPTITSSPEMQYLGWYPAGTYQGQAYNEYISMLVSLSAINENYDIVYAETIPFFQVYVQGSGEYIPTSDVEALFLDTYPNPTGTAATTMTLGPTDDLVLYIALQNNGPDAVTAPVAFDITFDGVSLLTDTIPYSDEENDDLPNGYYQPINFSQTQGQYAPLTISAAYLDGIVGTFDVCFSVSYTGTDNNNENDETCITVTRFVNDTIWATANEFGTITPNGEVIVVEGTDQPFTITANDSCRLVSVMVDDTINVTADLVDGVYTFTNVTANHTINATFERIPTYTITASANEFGTITPNGENVVLEGQSLQVTIAANDCYRIASVLVDGEEAINDLVNGVYTFENIVANHTIAVTFEQITYTITATAGENGTIDPEGEVTVNCGENKEFTIAPNTGYRILSLLVDGVSQPTENNVYIFENVTANHTIEVTFVDENATTHTITATAGEHGTINPVGAIEVLGGENKEFTITADNCYRIASVLVDGDTVTSDLVDGVYTFENVAADHTIAAIFEIITYTITASANESGTITPNNEGGEIVNCGDNQSFTIAANDSCRLVSVMVDDTINVTDQLVDGVYTFTNVAANHTIAATFERIPVYTITASANEFGTITPASVTVMEDENASFTIAANDSCRIVSVMVDETNNVTADLVDGVYTFTNVNAAHTIAATFEAIPTFTITATANDGGTITPASVTVMEGENAAFTIAANNGYRIVSVMVDETNNVTANLVNGVYTFTNVNANHTIAATFEEIPTYTITATAGENGTINPSGEITVVEGATQAFTITPNGGYRIASVLVDGVEAIENIVDGVYVFQNVNANHTISVAFTESVSVDMIEAGSMAIYPNPNTGMFSIDFSNINGDAIYQLIDARGAVVETRNISVMDGETMNFNYNLRAGAYFVRIISNDKVYVEQIVVE